ncbi:hypothetical protein [Pectobacterium parmentieri]|nr:hypothetical protein [Pectobacterium parmentieri]
MKKACWANHTGLGVRQILGKKIPEWFLSHIPVSFGKLAHVFIEGNGYL